MGVLLNARGGMIGIYQTEATENLHEKTYSYPFQVY